MNKLFKVLLVIISSIIMILSLAFIVIEGRLLFSGDWLIYDNPFNGFIRYLCRLLIAIFAFTKSLLEVIYINKKHSIKDYLYYGDISLVLMSLSILVFSTNYVGIICTVLANLLLLVKFVNFKVNK